MNVKSLLLVLATTFMASVSEAQDIVYTFDEDECRNIFGGHRHLEADYDFDDTYTRVIEVKNLSMETNPWVLVDVQSNMSGSGTDVVDLYELQPNTHYRARARFIPDGSLEALVQPAPESDPFVPWTYPSIVVEYNPIGVAPSLTFRIDVSEHGDGPPNDQATAIMHIVNTTTGNSYNIPHSLGNGGTSTELYPIVLLEPGYYEICYSLTIESYGFNPQWGPYTVYETCPEDMIAFGYDISTGISFEPKQEEVLGLSVYPNPTIDYVRVKNAVVGSPMIVTDEMGRTVIEKRAAHADELIEMATLPAGTYTVSQPGTGLSTRLVKQ